MSDGGPQRHHEKLGEEGSVALRFDDPRLRERWAELVQQGATWRWPSYKPHITLFVDPSFDPSKLVPYPGPLEFGPEEWKEIEGKHRDQKDERLAKGRPDQPRDDRGRWTSGEGGITAYHGTQAGRLNRIKEQGLVPSKWSPDGKVYVTTSYADAKGYAETGGTRGVVLKIEIPKSFAQKLREDPLAYEGTRFLRGTIPAKYIKSVEFLPRVKKVTQDEDTETLYVVLPEDGAIKDEVVTKGGPGSGNFGHSGRPGEGPGGSGPSEGGGGEQHAHLTTDQRHRDKHGNYTASRQALHKEIIQKQLRGAKPVANPTVYFMGGGPGSGKSTLVESGMLGDLSHAAISSSDEVKEHLPEYREGIREGRSDAAVQVHQESSDVASMVTGVASRQGLNLVIDGTGDGSYERIKEKVERLQGRGMRVEANYVTVPIHEALRRVELRARETGRYVPKSFVVGVHQRIRDALPRAMREGIFDKATVWDNSGSAPRAIASSAGGHFTVHDKDAWDKFRKGE